nr:HVO_2922 family protein [Halovenus aranensis]
MADGGEGYASESEAENAVVRIREYGPDAHVLDVGSAAFEVYEDNAGEWRWQLRHRNGNLMANSGEGYASRTGAEDGIHSVKHNAPNAEVA